MIDPDLRGNTSQSIGHAAGNENNYNDNDDDYDDDYEDEDYDDEYYQGEDMEEDQADGTAIFSQPARLGSKVPQTSQRKQTNNQQNNIGPSAQRQRHQQQQQQQQRQRAHAAVEKRYRSVVNSKIRQISALIPASDTFSLSDPNAPPEDQGAEATQKVPTKSVVLDRAIQYINHLVSSYQRNEMERNELRRKLQLWLDDTSLS